MRRVGLTGGIASGKSAVAAILREMGFRVLDADRLAHSLIEPGQPAYDGVVGEFGDSILDASRKIDRGKLGGIVFADRAKLDRLNAMVHPRVREAMHKQFEEWRRSNPGDAVFVEAALLVEAGLHTELDGLVVAWCRPEQQLERLVARGMSKEEAQRRISMQLPVEEKLRHATERIDCSGTLQTTRKQVQALAARLRGAASK